MGSSFGILEAPWEAVLAPRDHPGGAWEQQQDEQEVANDRILVDLGMILGPVSISFCVQNA